MTIEEPLEFSIAFGAHSSREIKNLAVTMRTPGNDFELVLGFLYSEGIIKNAFSQTGGLHASALFDQQGSILSLFEDVGRHNALDKLIGCELQNNNLPLFQSGLILSGRTSFELIHKAALPGIPVVVSIGAPSSLAVDAAWEYEITLAGFLQADRFNIYSFPRRIN